MIFLLQAKCNHIPGSCLTKCLRKPNFLLLCLSKRWFIWALWGQIFKFPAYVFTNINFSWQKLSIIILLTKMTLCLMATDVIVNSTTLVMPEYIIRRNTKSLLTTLSAHFVKRSSIFKGSLIGTYSKNTKLPKRCWKHLRISQPGNNVSNWGR